MFGKMCFCSAVILGMCGDAFAYTDPQINQLISEKQQKIEALQKCAAQTKGFKIAGISTIGLTTVGVATNVVLANKKQTINAAPTVKLDASKDGVGFVCKNISAGEIEEYDDDKPEGYANCKNVNNNGDWCVQFDEYIVKGTSTCVNEGGVDYTSTTTDYGVAKSEGQNCWCKITSWTPNGSGKIETPASRWVFNFECSSDSCTRLCPDFCADDMLNERVFREAMFGAIK